MKKSILIIVILNLLILSSCVTTSVVMTDNNLKYPPSQSVLFLSELPDKPYITIAILETKGYQGKSFPDLLENMREKAKRIGADAIIPTQEGVEKLQQGVIYNPWLGGYQTIGGGSNPILRGVAIKFK
jgi:hypothetical protein